MTGAVFIVVMFALMWAVVIVPQQRRVKRHRALIEALEVGDEVVTAGGLVGTVAAIEGDDLLLSLGDEVSVRVVRQAVAERREDPSLDLAPAPDATVAGPGPTEA